LRLGLVLFFVLFVFEKRQAYRIVN